MILTTEDYRLLAKMVKEVHIDPAKSLVYREQIYQLWYKDSTTITQYIKLYPKERPRVGKFGRVYTPETTRLFEADVKSFGKTIVGSAVLHPVHVKLTLLCVGGTYEHNVLGLTDRVLNGDLDNYAKAIFDALNKVAWKDDRQIKSKSVVEHASDNGEEGFTLTVWRAGLSKTELANLRKFVALS